MAVAKVFTNGVIVNGRATICVPAGFNVVVPTGEIFHDDLSREQIYDQPSGTVMNNIQTRYKYHGGTGGSGNWEH